MGNMWMPCGDVVPWWCEGSLALWFFRCAVIIFQGLKVGMCLESFFRRVIHGFMDLLTFWNHGVQKGVSRGVCETGGFLGQGGW